jgi:hypothetical protein
MKTTNLSTPKNSFEYVPRKNDPHDSQGIRGIMYEKKVKNPDGSITTKLKNFTLNSAGFHTKALASGYSPLTKETAKAYMASKGMSNEGAETVLKNIATFKYIDAKYFETTINSQKNKELESGLDALKKAVDGMS